MALPPDKTPDLTRQLAADLLPPMPPFRPFTRRRRLLIVVVATATTATIGVTMLAPDVAYLQAQLARLTAGPPTCTEGQTEACVGGRTEVIVMPSASAASR
jgi:hypothetical protein